MHLGFLSTSGQDYGVFGLLPSTRWAVALKYLIHWAVSFKTTSHSYVLPTPNLPLVHAVVYQWPQTMSVDLFGCLNYNWLVQDSVW